MTGLNEFLVAPLFDHVLLTRMLVAFTLFLLIIRFLPAFARNLTLLIASVAAIEITTSPFYTFGFIAFTGLLYYGLFWMQWSARKELFSKLISVFLVILFFLLMDLPLLHSQWTGQMVHRFGIAYSLFRFLMVTIDVGRGKPLPSDPLEFFVYAFFAPTFFQGPIERLDEFRKNLLDEERPLLNWSETGSYFIRIAVALLKGWVVVNFLELDWKQYFDYPQGLSYSQLLWGMYARAIGFYVFVSAANDLTIACSGLAGYRIQENYDYPYFKKNLALFWRSWHITLFRFLRDYVYIPLGGNKHYVYRNILIVFMAAALWHVTSTAFVIWGLWHGLGVCFLRAWQNFWKKIEEENQPGFLRSLQLWTRRYPRTMAVASTLFTFHYVALSWLPFWGGHPQGLNMIVKILSGNQWKLFEWTP